jgi:dihydropteroate synthase
MSFKHARGYLELDRCRVMGIVNRTPDSFYDGGRMSLEEAVDHAVRLVDEGADILDIGAVKAGPGEVVEEAEELERLLPLVEGVASRVDVPISIETSRSSVARRAFDAGASILNDVSGLGDADLARACADAGAGLVVMHHGGQIRSRPRHPTYEDVVKEVGAELTRLAGTAEASGVERDAILIDPGLDFGKNTFHSLELMRRLSELTELGYPVLIAASRKDVVGETLDLPPDQRLEGSLALAAIAAMAGASVVRAHDVLATVRAVTMAEAVQGRIPPQAPVRGLWD